MIINLQDPRVGQAIELVKKTHDVPFGQEFERIFEQKYHCKIVQDSNDPFCINGKLHISEEKYANWFVLQFGT